MASYCISQFCFIIFQCIFHYAQIIDTLAIIKLFAITRLFIFIVFISVVFIRELVQLPGVSSDLQYRMSACIDIIANRLQLVAWVTERNGRALCVLRETRLLRHVLLAARRRWRYVSNRSCSKRAYNYAFRENLNNLLSPGHTQPRISA